MVDFQRLTYVSRSAVHRRVVRRLTAQTTQFVASHGIFSIDKGGRKVFFDLEQLAVLLDVLRPWERVIGFHLHRRLTENEVTPCA